MNTKLALKHLGPRVKLLRRHVQEWNDLLIHQKQLRQLTNESCNSIAFNRNELNAIKQITLQSSKLAQLAVRQAQERQNLIDRQKQEEIELEQVFKSILV